jgi:Protein of unknown function (DUF4240)
MHTVFEIPIESANDSMLQGYREQYPNAVVRIEAHFWAIVGLFDWQKQDDEAIMKAAAEALAQFSFGDIEVFYNLLAEKLYVLDGRQFAVQLGSNRYSEQNDCYFSVDDFLYSRCGVVARGKTFFDTVLQNPARMPKEFTFESILYLPHAAHERKTGRRDFQHVTPIWYETFSNPDGWPGITPLKDRILAQ